MQAVREGAARLAAVLPADVSEGSWDWAEQESPSAA